MKFQIYGLQSNLNAGENRGRREQEFVDNLKAKTSLTLEWVNSPDEFHPEAIPLIFVQGGSENRFLRQIDNIPKPTMLLTIAGNSLAASLEILTHLQNRGIKGKIIHGDLDYVANRLKKIEKIQTTRQQLANAKLGVIGQPSDWLIASLVEKTLVKDKFGCEVIDIPLEELILLSRESYEIDEPLVKELRQKSFAKNELDKALNIYGALCKIKEKYQINGLTLRCFDLIESLQSTGCIGLALLNANGFPSACEGDVPSLISMMILQLLLGEPGFMANPSRIDVAKNTMVLAHCTAPINIGNDYKLNTHFESGIGVAVDAHLPEQNAMMFKVAPDLNRYFLSELQILRNLSENNMCRTQIEIKLNKDVHYFLNEPCANHHIITLKSDINLLREFMEGLD